MSNLTLNLSLTLVGEQAEQFQEMQALSGKDSTTIVRKALELLYEKVMNDEDIKQKVKINSLLDVQ